MSWKIPFNRPHVVGSELAHVSKAIERGNASADGDFTEACSALLAERFGIHRVLMTTSCTAALEVAALLCELSPGDEVIMPSFTHVSTAHAFVRAGARPVFVDVRPDTLNLDEAQVAEAVGERTRAIVPVHYAGVACAMDPIAALARERGLRVVEDAAQAVHAGYRGRKLGSLGDLGAYSFHETKNVSSGQGGALCVNDPALVARAEVVRDRGTNRKSFFRGEVDRYTWVDAGSCYAQSELLCAYLLAQLQALDEIARRRAGIYGWYRELLAPLEARGRLRLPIVPGDAEPNHHLFYLLLPDRESRDGLRRHLAARGIQAVSHYEPLHASPMGRRLGPQRPLPVSEDVSRRILRLPLFNDLSRGEVAQVAEAVAGFLDGPRP